ncbi:unnamed protein product [Sphenostylis stenocarpa]|uniref:Uncharacterized protein n=1 Tax=Sphenostylis stenocarpa TaxID=92480 RepID=A0AA86T2I5_9FABA|nr:unnamed protein product [Sphenostylis stenocarpa]
MFSKTLATIGTTPHTHLPIVNPFFNLLILSTHFLLLPRKPFRKPFHARRNVHHYPVVGAAGRPVGSTASMSCTTRAMLLVLGGTLCHSSGGEMSYFEPIPSCVQYLGRFPFPSLSIAGETNLNPVLSMDKVLESLERVIA